MTGYRDGHMAVEHYKGDWILRAALDGDLPLVSSAEATAAMDAWRDRNAAKFRESIDATG